MFDSLSPLASTMHLHIENVQHFSTERKIASSISPSVSVSISFSKSKKPEETQMTFDQQAPFNLIFLA